MSMNLFNVSSSPHVRNRLSTGLVMYDVILALLPVTFVGVWRFGFHALLVILTSIVSAMLAEFVFDYLTGKENTLRDGSAIVTGLLLALCLPAGVPLYLPYIGAVFAIAVVKGLFGGLGKNILNPALAGRCFLLLSFSGSMTRYVLDGVTSATPLAQLASGGSVDVVRMFTGHAGGVIGSSAFALLVGGLYLWAVDGITWQIPVSVIGSFAAFLVILSPETITPGLLMAHIAGGGLLMAAFFMATDPVTCPVTGSGQIVYGICVGFLSALFRVKGSSADSVSYAVILSNLATPLIDELIVPKPFAYRSDALENKSVSRKAAAWFENPVRAAGLICCAFAAVCVVLIGAGFATRGAVENRKLMENLSVYQAVLPDTASAASHDAASEAIAALNGGVYGSDFKNVTINSAVTVSDASGAEIGAVISVTSADGNDGPITLSVGILPDGSISAITFTDLNETPGIGIRAGEAAFTDQFAGLSGRLTLGSDLDAVSGATVTSTATVNAVNAALDFHAAYMR